MDSEQKQVTRTSKKRTQTSKKTKVSKAKRFCVNGHSGRTNEVCRNVYCHNTLDNGSKIKFILQSKPTIEAWKQKDIEEAEEKEAEDDDDEEVNEGDVKAEDQ